MREHLSVEVVILGSGTSHGVPMIGCRCPVCMSTDPRDHRTRPSVFIRAGDDRILIDTAPELRLQCLANHIDEVDAVLYTHHHADHVTGLDDLRRFNYIMQQPMPIHGTQRTLDALRRMFAYAFDHAPDSPHSRPELTLCPIGDEPFTMGQTRIIPIPLIHGRMEVLGFRVGDFAYCTDCGEIPESSLEHLNDLDVLVLDALRRRPHPAHFNLEQAVAMAHRIGARRTFFTHIAHDLMHEEVNRELPERMALAHDGLRLCTPQ
jgi:phosphoribosyl 1,2-cyclic phosphate phosphodiesterase